ncbi:hypothetical protein D3C80_1788410 [compost metagenome]
MKAFAELTNFQRQLEKIILGAVPLDVALLLQGLQQAADGGAVQSGFLAELAD